jgi:hypothetical protein
MRAPREFRAPRKARPHAGSKSAWYYLNPRTIDIFVEREGGGTGSCRLTKTQLEQALALMNQHYS